MLVWLISLLNSIPGSSDQRAQYFKSISIKTHSTLGLVGSAKERERERNSYRFNLETYLWARLWSPSMAARASPAPF